MLFQYTTFLCNNNLIANIELIKAAKETASALNKCIDCLPGQNDVNTAIDAIRDCSNSLKANVRGYFIGTEIVKCVKVRKCLINIFYFSHQKIKTYKTAKINYLQWQPVSMYLPTKSLE